MRQLFLGVFGGFCAVILLIGIVNFYHFSAVNVFQEEVVKTDRLAQRLQQHKEQMQLFGQHHILIDSVAASPEIWEKRNRDFWKKTWHVVQSNRLSLMEKELPLYDGYSGRRQLHQIAQSELLLIQSASRIGFKENGLIGQMRKQAHLIEKHSPNSIPQLLSLRRHEKDFLMRVDPVYSERLHSEYETWKHSAKVPAELFEYINCFDSLQKDYMQQYQMQPGGRFKHWQKQYDRFQEGVRKQRTLLLSASFTASSEAQTVNFILNTCAIILAIGCTILFTRKFSKQVKNLQQTMAQYIATNYQFAQEADLKIPRNDFGKITLHFLQLTRKIRMDMQLLEDRVQRRTKTLQLKNQQLESQHIEIMDSLRYAQDLQQSLLVSRSKMLRSFREAWVYYKPKNLVGGDFYWMKEVNDEQEHLIYFALADCTGHGVPGALLSVMGMNALDELIDAGIRQPAALLNELRALVSRRLNTHEDKRNDGMDMALILLNRHTNTVTFSGALLPMWILRKDELIECNGQRMPIGYTFFDVSTFCEQSFQLLPEDKLILFTDGIVDQFGGIKQKKFGRKMLREWLVNASDESTPHLFSKLVHHFECWRGQEEQTDDCTILVLEPHFTISATQSEKQAASYNGLISIGSK